MRPKQFFTITCVECGSVFVFVRQWARNKRPVKCTPCSQAKARATLNEWRRRPENREVINARQRAYIASNPEKTRRRHEAACAKKYGLSLARYLELAYGNCAICGSKCDSRERLAIDHDHACCPKDGMSCGECIRDALCMACNLLVGHMEKAGAEIVFEASRYLQYHRST